MGNADDQPTCGKGLAASSRLPAKMAQFLAALADNLEVHMGALDVADPAARMEHEAYASLLSKYRQIVTALTSAAAEMAGYEDLPMAPHDEEALAAPRVIEVFRNYVEVEGELLDLFEESHEINRDMLNEMGILEEGE